MNSHVNMILVLEKELELERHGLRRTRRWIGDANQVTDARWYRAQVSKTDHHLGKAHSAAETQARRKAQRSFLARLLHLPRPDRRAAYNEC